MFKIDIIWFLFAEKKAKNGFIKPKSDIKVRALI